VSPTLPSKERGASPLEQENHGTLLIGGSLAAEVHGIRTGETQAHALRKALQKVEKRIEDFYKIYEDLPKHQGDNP
jgi:hypothetical protein